MISCSGHLGLAEQPRQLNQVAAELLHPLTASCLPAIPADTLCSALLCTVIAFRTLSPCRILQRMKKKRTPEKTGSSVLQAWTTLPMRPCCQGIVEGREHVFICLHGHQKVMAESSNKEVSDYMDAWMFMSTEG